MSDKMTFMAKWLDDISSDENLEISEQEMAYIVYAAVVYGIKGKKLNMTETFGDEFRFLNMAMPNIYGQIDNIQGYNPGRVVKYDSEEIKRLRLEGKKASEICEILGYPQEKAKSITTNKGWKEAGLVLGKDKNKGASSSELYTKTEKICVKNTQKNFDF